MEKLGELIVEHQPTGMMIPYHHTVRLCDQRYDWAKMRSVKAIIPAGTRVPLEIETDLKSKFPAVILSNVYGSIETGGAVSGTAGFLQIFSEGFC